jgi:amino acid adenylation domain-containing protein
MLRLLSESEERELLSFSGADDDYPRGETIVDLFEQQAERRSEHLALQSDAEVVTYGELHRRSNQLARLLRSLGAGRDVPVGVLMERGPAMIAALLAIFKAGAAYLPLDRSLPLARIADMVNDSLTPIIVTDAASEGALPSFIGTPLNLDTEAAEIASESTEALATRPDPGDLAYLIYTSGSTGAPKVVAVEHRGLTNVAAVQRRLFGVMPDDRVLQFAAPGFDASMFEISMALCWGATLRLGSRERLMPGESLVQFLGDERVSILTLPPSALAVTPSAHLPYLRVLNVAGEACPPELPTLWGKARHFFDLYGPSEATIWSTAASFDAGHTPPCIGKPIANTRVYIVTSSLQPVPVGVPGEIVIGGVGVARGYLHRPAFTAERFPPDPFGPTGARVFRTGDIGRWREDGTIEFLGRADHQVKIRGYRVELGEIEAVLARHPRVRAAAVVYRPHQNGAVHLDGYVVPAGDRVDVQELRTWLRASLPEYMVPTTITPLGAFPTTASGKIDKSALPDSDANVVDASRDFVAPRTPLESVLARMFADVLGRERVGVTENFFDIGGHSLLATRVVSRLREVFHVEFSLAQFFQEDTVAELADALNTMQPETAEKVARALEKLRAMSPAQKQELRARAVRVQHHPI